MFAVGERRQMHCTYSLYTIHEEDIHAKRIHVCTVQFMGTPRTRRTAKVALPYSAPLAKSMRWH
jgi:hypothetical protein